MKCIPPLTPLIYSKSGLYRGIPIFSSPEPKAHKVSLQYGSRAVVRASVHASVHASVRSSTLSILNISETSRPIAVRFYMKQHWVGGLPAIGF